MVTTENTVNQVEKLLANRNDTVLTLVHQVAIFYLESTKNHKLDRHCTFVTAKQPYNGLLAPPALYMHSYCI